MYWANFLHIYQPPTQTEAIVRKVANESYHTLVRILRRNPRARVTLNISATLTQQLVRYGLDDILVGLRALAERGQLEFTASGMYHPILPLIPWDEAARQVKLNFETNRRYLGDVYNPRGLFPPEMCYGPEVARLAQEFGCQWIIVDEIACGGKLGAARNDVLYELAGLEGLLVFFKERPFSAGITYGRYPDSRSFLDALGARVNTNSYLLTGTDGEVYGHHRPGQERLLEEVWEYGQPPTCTISELISLFPRREKASPLTSSWSAWEDEMAQHIPYPQWDYPGHEIHALQWQLTRLALSLISGLPEQIPGFQGARLMLDEGLHSCQYWWASCRPWWDTTMIEWGARKLLDAILCVKGALSESEVQRASSLFASILTTAHRWHKAGEAGRRKEEYLAQHREVSSELSFGEGAR